MKRYLVMHFIKHNPAAAVEAVEVADVALKSSCSSESGRYIVENCIKHSLASLVSAY